VFCFPFAGAWRMGVGNGVCMREFLNKTFSPPRTPQHTNNIRAEELYGSQVGS
jgi:hypothetical protein